jgi:hypothetical protein
MICFVNGNQYDVPTSPDGAITGDVIRRAGGIPSNRALILKKGNGENQIVNPGSSLRVRPMDQFSDLPQYVAGGGNS